MTNMVIRIKSRFPKRRKPGEMNKIETIYADHLDLLKKSSNLIDYQFEAIKFKLADNTYYTPDFTVITNDSFIELHEVKAVWRNKDGTRKIHCEDDAKVKIKVAANQFWWAKFVLIGYDYKTKQWIREDI